MIELTQKRIYVSDPMIDFVTLFHRDTFTVSGWAKANN